LQLFGDKIWQIYEPTIELPLNTQKSGSLDESTLVPHRSGHKKLTPGDVLYLPRGTIHAAHTTTNSSVHITIAIQSTLWADALEWLQKKASSNSIYRRTIPHFEPDGLKKDLCQKVQGLQELAKNSALLEEFLSARRARSKKLFPAEVPLAWLEEIISGANVTKESCIVAVFGESDVVYGKASFNIKVLGKRFTGPAWISGLIRRMVGCGPVLVGDICEDIGIENAEVLVAKLWSEGFIMPATPPHAYEIDSIIGGPNLK